jgi:hypothetical protein
MPLPAGVDLDPPVTAEEARLIDAIAHELGTSTVHDTTT